MDVFVERTLVGEFDKFCDALAEGPENWMPGSFESPAGEIMKLEAATAVGRLDRYARVRVGRAERTPDEVIVPVSWRALEAQPLFPTFEGRLRLSRHSDKSIRLTLEGHYKPPAGTAGHAGDAAVMHVVAEQSIKDFVERVASVLARNALARSVASQVEAGRLTLDEA